MGNDLNISELKAAAVGMHEYFTTLVEAGFTEDQAIQLLAAAINGHQG